MQQQRHLDRLTSRFQWTLTVGVVVLALSRVWYYTGSDPLLANLAFFAASVAVAVGVLGTVVGRLLMAAARDAREASGRPDVKPEVSWYE